MGFKYDALRSDLTEMGYTEAFSLDSAPLVARLWSDLCSYQEQCVDANTALRRTVQERQEKEDLAERYRQENAKALAEVNRLHSCIMQLKEKHTDKLNDLENRLQEAEQCKKKFEFVKADCVNKIKHLEKELQLKSDKILQLQSALSTQAVVHVTDTAKVPASYRTQGIELTSLLPRQHGVAGRKAGPPTAARDAQEIDIIRMADTRIHQLQHERRDLKESLYQSRVSVDLLQQRIEARNAEIERLTRTLREGLPHTALQEGCSCGQNLQPQGKEDGKGAPTELHSTEPKKPAPDKQPVKQVRKVNFGHLHRKTDPRARDPKPAKSKRPPSATRQADQQSKGLTLEEQIQALEEEKQRLKERVKQLASSERHLLIEIQGLLANKGQTAASDSSEELRALQRERDHYKDELMRLHQVLKSGNTSLKKPSSSGSESGNQADPKNMAADLENAVQQKKDLELQIQEYVIKVAKIEELLRTRDQEREDLLDQYRSLISANADLRTQAEQSQREQDSSDATLNSLRQQLARHMSVTSEQEQKLASLGATVAALQESLQRSAAEGSRLKEELQKSSDTRARLAEQVESLQDQLAKEQTVNNQISGHLRRLEDDLSLARTEAATARSDATSLERLLATSREQRCQTDIALERLSAEMEKMKQDMQAGATSRAAQNEENNFLRSKLSEFEHAVEQLKQQVINEQYEREKCKEELNRLQQQARSGLNGKLTLHGFTGSFQTRLNFSPENGTRPPQ
ncbi:hypothetical protein HPB52_018316 [Rhipicephalus sanguineus]|uniref:Centrosomal protein of 135 kDa n=2 Tax=Rhipicephalus sanguineus TaxID=34632 RepID=A0A9D4Q7B0_RHISA|nr:hypothetical protein HPB52_018316 [Rhipicephalus sanguineus]